MKEYLRKYDVKLIVKGPVFVGSGREISKKEYIFLPDKKIGIIDIGLFSQQMYKKGKQRQFEDFVLNERRFDLGDWMERNSVRYDTVKDCMKYVLDMGDTVLQRGTRVQVMEFIKDPYGMVYVPGSTIKGMLRTIILTSKLYNDGSAMVADKLRRGIRNEANLKRNRYLSREIKETEASILNTLNRNPERIEDAVNDYMSGFVVSDSDPIDLGQLVLCQKIERHIDETEKRLNLLRETLSPGTEIKFTITIDESVTKMGRDDILEAVSTFNDIYNECFLSKFRGVDLPSGNTVYLGGGSGFASKTVIYSIFGEEGLKLVPEIFRNTNVPREHGHDKDVKLGVSPHIVKCTYYEGKTLRFGECRLEI